MKSIRDLLDLWNKKKEQGYVCFIKFIQWDHKESKIPLLAEK